MNVAECSNCHKGKRPNPAQVAPGLSPKPGHIRQQRGINAAVRELGLDRTQTQRAIKIAGLTSEAKAAAIEAGRDDT